jgi:hypothetical protein
VTMAEDGVRPGELVDVKVVPRAGEVAEEAVEEAAGGGRLSDNKSVVSDRGDGLIGDASSSVLVAATGGPFWFPFGPGGPFLLLASPGAFVFTGPRAASDSL